jgi:hypothetical protein
MHDLCMYMILYAFGVIFTMICDLRAGQEVQLQEGGHRGRHIHGYKEISILHQMFGLFGGNNLQNGSEECRLRMRSTAIVASYPLVDIFLILHSYLSLHACMYVCMYVYMYKSM